MQQATCPTRRSNRVEAPGRKHALYPSGCLCLIGFPLARFHQGQFPDRFRCGACDHHFTRRSALAMLNLVLLVLIASLYLFFMGTAIVSIFLRA